jgi:hypothetical protein
VIRHAPEVRPVLQSTAFANQKNAAIKTKKVQARCKLGAWSVYGWCMGGCMVGEGCMVDERRVGGGVAPLWVGAHLCSSHGAIESAWSSGMETCCVQ